MTMEAVNGKSVVHTKRFVATSYMTPLKEIEEKGNSVQAKAAFLFDYNGDGYIQEGTERDDFNNSRFSLDGDTLAIYPLAPNKGVKPKTTVNLKVQREAYDKKVLEFAKRQEKIEKNIKELTKYGLGQWKGWAEEIDRIVTKTVNGVKVLSIETRDYKMEMPLDKNYKPENLGFSGGEGCFGLSGFRGTFTIKPTAGYFNYTFENSDCKIVCADGQEDLIKYKNSKVTIKTGDWADVAYGNGKEVHLRPGTRTLDDRIKEDKKTDTKTKTADVQSTSKEEAKDILRELHK